MILDQSILDGFLQMAGPEMAADLLHELLDAYAEDVPQRLVAIERAIAQSDPEALRQAAHALRSGSINLGAVQVGQLCRELEQMGKSGRHHRGTSTLSATPPCRGANHWCP